MKPTTLPARTALASALLSALLLSACNTTGSGEADKQTAEQQTADLQKTPANAVEFERLPETSWIVDEPVAEDKAERIEVTGSHVRGRDNPQKTREILAAERRAEAAQQSVAAPAPLIMTMPAAKMAPPHYAPPPEQNRENYLHAGDNPVKAVAQEPVSTFALDVDTGAYSNVRRYLRQGDLPPKDAVRVEELINYFEYQDAPAERGHPFALQTELSVSPWQPENYLLRVRIKATDMQVEALPPVNLVFLVDVSGSMQDQDKLPLVQSSLRALVNELRPQDTISLVVYAGRTQVELPATSGKNKAEILAAIDRLTAGGSTAGGAAIELAYSQAMSAFKPNGINRILLATDGDFNVGITDIGQLKTMVEQKRESGITLTTLGFGQGNYNDALMEQIADVGNGNYAYIDSADEARKVLITEMSSTFAVVAKDAKIQIEFNPGVIAEYRLIGYENRMLNEADFNNDKIDAGDVGAGKSVTALYELTPVGGSRLIEPRRYQGNEVKATKEVKTEELAFLRVRYKPSANAASVLLEKPILQRELKKDLNATSADFRFSVAVAGFGQLLRGGSYTRQWQMNDSIALAKAAKGQDNHGYRAEFIRLAEIAGGLLPQRPVMEVNREVSAVNPE